MATVKLDDKSSIDLLDGEAIVFANCPNVWRDEKGIYPVNLVITNKRVVSIPYPSDKFKGGILESWEYSEMANHPTNPHLHGNADPQFKQYTDAGRAKFSFLTPLDSKRTSGRFTVNVPQTFGGMVNALVGESFVGSMVKLGRNLFTKKENAIQNVAIDWRTIPETKAVWPQISGQWDKWCIDGMATLNTKLYEYFNFRDFYVDIITHGASLAGKYK